jgi:hypothetical protein
MRWNKKYDGTKESLIDKSHRPHSTHPNAHTPKELKWIQDYHRRNPKISVCELYGKLRTAKGYSRHPGSLYHVYRRLGYSSSAPSTKKMSKPKPYDTPTELGIKWQMDVKYVPTVCYSLPSRNFIPRCDIKSSCPLPQDIDFTGFLATKYYIKFTEYY